MATILVLHGPNLNLLGQRDPGIYGAQTLQSINQQLADDCQSQGYPFACLQSKAEYELVERIDDAGREGVDLILFNPASFTHTRWALRHALFSINIPSIEVHLTKVHARAAYRQHS